MKTSTAITQKIWTWHETNLKTGIFKQNILLNYHLNQQADNGNPLVKDNPVFTITDCCRHAMESCVKWESEKEKYTLAIPESFVLLRIPNNLAPLQTLIYFAMPLFHTTLMQ